MTPLKRLNLKIKLQYLIVIVFSIGLLSCQSKYEQTVLRERYFGGEHNELLFELRIGQKMQDFYDKCTELNKRKEVTQGEGVNAKKILYPKDSNGKEIEMLFFGLQDNERNLRGMRMRFAYKAWAPWAKDYQAEKLIDPIKDSLMAWFPGNTFFPVVVKNDSIPAYIKVDGNRRIILKKKSVRQLAVTIEDISGKFTKRDQ
jgi:hypothetical protein